MFTQLRYSWNPVCLKPMNVRFGYPDVIKSLYKAGMPEGNIFDFTSSRILKFEHKWNTEQKKKAILERYKSMGKEDPKAILERSLVRSERSMSAKTSKSVKKEEPAAKGKDAKEKETPKGKEAASKSKEPAKPKKK